MSCRELVEFLDEYLAGGMEPARVSAFNEHLAACPPCVAYMKTYQRSRTWARESLLQEKDAVPEEVPEKLVKAVLAARRE